MRLTYFIFFIFLQIAATAQPACRDNHTPLVFVHGFLGSGDNWASQVQRFESNGYCSNRIFVFDWNSTGTRLKNDSLLRDFIDTVIARTAARKVNLIGHSAGGGLCYNFLKDGQNAKKVERYVHVGSSAIKKQAGPAGEIPTLVISSPDDKVIPRTGNADSSFRILIPGKDHLEIASCPEAFAAMYDFFESGSKPAGTAIIPTPGPHSIGGKVLMLGDNSPLAFQKLTIYAFDAGSGKRKSKKPLAEVTTDEKGNWSSINSEKDTWLECLVSPPQGRAVTYFIEPPVRNDRLLYLRCIPTSGLAANMMKNLPASKDQSLLAIFSSNHAIISGRDSLAVNDITLSTESLTPASGTTISVFLFDEGDGKSSLKPIKSMGPGIFLNAIDMMIPASDKKSALVYFNGRTIKVPCRQSDESAMVIVFR